jgi:hypothetical protein
MIVPEQYRAPIRVVKYDGSFSVVCDKVVNDITVPLHGRSAYMRVTCDRHAKAKPLTAETYKLSPNGAKRIIDNSIANVYRVGDSHSDICMLLLPAIGTKGIDQLIAIEKEWHKLYGWIGCDVS